MTENKVEEIKVNDLSDLNLKYSLFLGCVIPNRYPMIERASRNVMKKLGIELIDMKGASCCPAPGVFRGVDSAVWLTIGARNINIAQNNGADLLTFCNGCYGTLIEIDHSLKHDNDLKKKINQILAETGREFDGSIRVRQIMDVLYFDIGTDRLKKLVKDKLGLKCAIHYGCHLLKPSKVRPFGSNIETPTFFEEIVETLGCQSIDYKDKMLCCGAGGGVRTTFKNTSLNFTLTKLREIKKVGADCIVVCCPFCNLQFDLGQLEVKNLMAEGEEAFNIPVIFITQLMGLAMGMEYEDLGMIKPSELKGVSPFISVQPILDKVTKIRNQEVN
jgi:heterodisulfide reductase subunit B2